jgi:hypothetical protein
MPLDYGQALLKEHPEWCVGEKRVRSLNRMLNEIVDSTDTSRQNGLEHSGETRRDEVGEDFEWEDLVGCESSGDKEWIFVEKPFEL